MSRSYVMCLAAAFSACMMLSVPLQAQTSPPPIEDGSKVTLQMTITVPNDHLTIPPHTSEYTHGAKQLDTGP